MSGEETKYITTVTGFDIRGELRPGTIVLALWMDEEDGSVNRTFGAVSYESTYEELAIDRVGGNGVVRISFDVYVNDLARVYPLCVAGFERETPRDSAKMAIAVFEDHLKSWSPPDEE